MSLVSSEFVVIVTLLFREVRRRRWFFHNHFGKQARLESIKVASPFLVVVDAHRKTNRTIVVFGKIGETPASIHNIAVLTDVVLAGLGTAVIGNGIGWAVDATSSAVITKLGDTCVNGFVCPHGNGIGYLIAQGGKG